MKDYQSYNEGIDERLLHFAQSLCTCLQDKENQINEQTSRISDLVSTSFPLLRQMYRSVKQLRITRSKREKRSEIKSVKCKKYLLLLGSGKQEAKRDIETAISLCMLKIVTEKNKAMVCIILSSLKFAQAPLLLHFLISQNLHQNRIQH